VFEFLSLAESRLAVTHCNTKHTLIKKDCMINDLAKLKHSTKFQGVAQVVERVRVWVCVGRDTFFSILHTEKSTHSFQKIYINMCVLYHHHLSLDVCYMFSGAHSGTFKDLYLRYFNGYITFLNIHAKLRV
jgi:hypothetical protein